MSQPENVHDLFQPHAAAMHAHLEFLFGGYLDGFHDGLIELAWTDTIPRPDGRYPLRHAQLFGTDQFDEIVARALELNVTPMCNVYVGAALRRPDAPPFGRASAADVLALTCAYTDLDDPGMAEAAKDKYGPTKPGMIVVTGSEPAKRAQLWWRLAEPLTDQGLTEGLLKGMAAALGGDPTVSDAPRVMRLAGTIAWPMKPDRKRPEVTYIAPLKVPGQPVYAYGHLARLFPPVYGVKVEGVRFEDEDGLVRGTTILGMPGKVEDRRERYMLKTSNAVLIQIIGETGKCPTAQELFDASWDQYARGADLTKPGKGKDEYAAKCEYTVKRFHAGKIKGCETIEKVQRLYADRERARQGHEGARAAPEPDPPKIDPATGEPLPLFLSAAQFVAGFTPPAYLIDGVMQRGYLYSLTARTGHGKTAVAMYIAQAVARDLPMHGKAVEAGTVLLLAGENPDDIRARFLVLADHYGFKAEDLKMKFVAGVVNIEDRMQEIQQQADLIDDLVLVIVDTAAAYFPGDETNNNSQQGAYARVLRRLTFLKGKPAVLVCCHPVKNAARDNLIPMGGSAFLNEVDGNLTLWANGDKQTTLHWLGKFRGPEFNSMAFEMAGADSAKVIDVNGRLMPSVVAKPISSMAMQAAEVVQEADENKVLKLMNSRPKASFADLAVAMGFVAGTEPERWKIQRIMDRLKDDGLIKKYRKQKYTLTPKGKGEIGVGPKVKDEEDFG